MTLQETSPLELTWGEQHASVIGHYLKGGNIDEFMRAVDIVCYEIPPGLCYEAQYLINSIVTPRDMHKSLVAGALRVARDNNMFNVPEFDENIAQHVGIALATAMIWEESHPLESVFHQDTMDAIAQAERKIKGPVALADFQSRLWTLVNMGLDTFDAQVIRHHTPHTRSWYAERLLSSLIVADVKDEFNRDGFEATSRLVDLALNENFEGATRAFRMAAEEMLVTKTPDTWKQRIADMAIGIADRIHSSVQCQDFLLPILKALHYEEEDVRVGIVEYIVNRFSRDEEQFTRLVSGQLFVGSDQRIGILLLRGYDPKDRAVTRLLDQVRKIPTADIDIEIAELWAWWESRGFDVHANIQSMLDTYWRQYNGVYDQMMTYMPRMMTVEGGLAVLRHGFFGSKDKADYNWAATDGLFAAIDAWQRNGMLSTDALKTLEGFIEEFSGQIPDELRSNVQAALYKNYHSARVSK